MSGHMKSSFSGKILNQNTPHFKREDQREKSFMITSLNHHNKPNEKTNKIFPKPISSDSSNNTKQSFKLKLNHIFGSAVKSETFHEILDKNAPDVVRNVNLLNLLRILMKAVNRFRFRTKYRGVRFINERQIELINDVSNFREKMQRGAYLKRYTEKNIIKRLYYMLMSFLCSAWVIMFIKNQYEKFTIGLDHYIPVIKPYQKIKILWDVLILFTIVGFFFLIPLQLGFGFDFDHEFHSFLQFYNIANKLNTFITLIPEIILVLDSLLKLITGYYENGLVITEKNHIIHHYLKKGLVFDLLSYCPILAQSIFNQNGLTIKLLQLLVFCKLKRVQIIVQNFQEMISLNGKHDYILSLIILTFQIIFFCHINACIWHSVAYYYPSDDVKTWIDYSGIKSLEWSEKYYYSLFWSVSVMVTIGFGEKISPQNNAELIVGVAILLSSALFFGYTINSMREIFDQMAKNEKEYKECLKVINEYMRHNNIDFELQGRVRKYLEYIMNKETNHKKEEEILDKLTKALKKEVILEANGKYLYQIPFFSRNFSAELIEQLAFTIKQVRYSPEEYIYHRGDHEDFSLFIVAKGNLDIIQENEYGTKGTLPLKAGDIIGARSFFTDESREFSVCSRNFSTLFEIKKSDFMRIIHKNAEDYEKFIYIKDKIMLYSSYNSINLPCLCCSKYSHLYNQCPLLHYIPDKDFLIKRHLYSPKQERGYYIRNSKKKPNALLCNSKVQEAVLGLGSSIFSLDDCDYEEECKPILKKMESSKTVLQPIMDTCEEYCDNDSFIEGKMSKRELLEENFKNELNKERFLKNAENSRRKSSHEEYEKNKYDENLKKALIFNEENFKSFQGFDENLKNLDEKSFVELSLKKPQISQISDEIFKMSDDNTNYSKKKSFEPNFRIPSFNKITPKNMIKKKSLNINPEKDMMVPNSPLLNLNNIDNTYEKLFEYSFEKIRIYNYYFSHNNVNKVIEMIKIRNNISSSVMKRSRKKKIEMKIRSSKFMFEGIGGIEKRNSLVLTKGDMKNLTSLKKNGNL